MDKIKQLEDELKQKDIEIEELTKELHTDCKKTCWELNELRKTVEYFNNTMFALAACKEASIKREAFVSQLLVERMNLESELKTCKEENEFSKRKMFLPIYIFGSAVK